MGKEDQPLSHSGSIDRRRALNKGKNELREKYLSRSAEIQELLKGDRISLNERASYSLEKVWLDFATGVITDDERKVRLNDLLNNSRFSDFLGKEDDNGVTEMVRIRDRVIKPAQTFGGYHTKRLVR